MNKNLKIGIVIQARFSSTRLPGKLFKNFYKSKKLIDVFLERILLGNKDRYPVVLATSTNNNDDGFEKIAYQHGIDLYRGSENDVLQRMIDAAESNSFGTIFRVCADNPIFDIESTLELIQVHKKESADYTAFKMKNGLPTIKSHLGFWGEVVEVSALKKVSRLTDDPIYHEHVTNYLYSELDKFRVRLVKAPDSCYMRDDIRLTVDTIEDFNLVKEIYSNLRKMYHTCDINEVINLIDKNPEYLKIMNSQIARFKK